MRVYISLIILLASTAGLYASLLPRESLSIDFYIYDIKVYNSNNVAGSKLSSRIKRIIASEKKLRITDTENIKDEPSCADNCIEEFKKLYSNGVVVSGEIIKKDIKTGEKQINKYITESIIRSSYKIKITVLDLNDNMIPLSFEKELNNIDELTSAVELFSKQISEYYRKKIEVAMTAAEKEKLNKLKEDELQSDKNNEYNSSGFSIMPSVVIPTGKYSEIFEYGLGAYFIIGAKVLPYKKIETNISFGIFDMKSKVPTIQSAMMLNTHITGGYNFYIYNSMVVTPYIGLGYTFQLINGDNTKSAQSDGPYSYKNTLYYNPSMIIGFEYAYIINSKYQIISSPYYEVYKDTNNLKSFFNANIGIRINW